MTRMVSTMRLEKELKARGLVPDECKLIEVRIEPQSALVVRYEVFVRPDQLDLFADALKAVAQQGLADDARQRAVIGDKP
jgi:hypothetical protein